MADRACFYSPKGKDLRENVQHREIITWRHLRVSVFGKGETPGRPAFDKPLKCFIIDSTGGHSHE
jgi:hypothetical protein